MKNTLSAAILAACAFACMPAEANAFGAAFKWCGNHSPAFQLTGLPAGTAKIALKMFDLEVPAYKHGGGTVAAGASIPCGAIKSGWDGPSPPPGAVHDYRWTLKALDASGKELGTATAERKFPEK